MLSYFYCSPRYTLAAAGEQQGGDDASHWTRGTKKRLQDTLFNKDGRRGRRPTCLLLSLMVMVVVVLGWVWHFKPQAEDYSGPLIVSPPPKLDTNYTTPNSSRLEIVISHYSEPLSDLALGLSAILSLPQIFALEKPDITVYTKHPTTPLSAIASALSLPENSVHRLPNHGREGGTYLHHILNNWDRLAHHTLFMQAELHYTEYFLQRLGDLFDPTATGFLPLGFTGLVCEIGSCVDTWGWKDRFGHLPALWTMLYGSLPPPGKISLTYKGQMAVSAARIRGIGRTVYEHLQYMLEAEDSPFAYEDPVRRVDKTQMGAAMDVEMDQRGSPEFGYTLERIWGLVWGCADGALAVGCPTLWLKRPGGVDDGLCQCFDTAA